jgi:DNA-directed RNA polymerase omega subunit
MTTAPKSADPALDASLARTVADQLQNKFLLVVLARQRARQLHAGARPRVEVEGHKHLWVAMREVEAGTVSWEVGPKLAGSAPA